MVYILDTWLTPGPPACRRRPPLTFLTNLTEKVIMQVIPAYYSISRRIFLRLLNLCVILYNLTIHTTLSINDILSYQLHQLKERLPT